MRRTIERLAWLLSKEESKSQTLGQLADKYDEPIDRIRDALDVIKIVHGQATQIPAIEWHASGSDTLHP